MCFNDARKRDVTHHCVSIVVLISPQMSHDRAAIGQDRATIGPQSRADRTTIARRSRIDQCSFSIELSNRDLRLLMNPRCPQSVDTIPRLDAHDWLQFPSPDFQSTIIKLSRVAPSYANIAMDHNRPMKIECSRSVHVLPSTSLIASTYSSF